MFFPGLLLLLGLLLRLLDRAVESVNGELRIGSSVRGRFGSLGDWMVRLPTLPLP